MIKEKKTWKEKAVSRSEEIKALKKRMKEMCESRDGWKEKAMKLKQEKKSIEDELKKNDMMDKNLIDMDLF